jgi:hypothetical protein
MKLATVASGDQCPRQSAGRFACVLVLIGLGILPCRVSGQCREEPRIQLNERAALSHLVAKRDAVLPERWPRRARLPKVVVRVRVDRQGKICSVRAVAGPPELRPHAVRTVQRHWRFRPFRVDWKPTAAEFSVSVKFVPPRREPRLVARDINPLSKIGRGLPS